MAEKLLFKIWSAVGEKKAIVVQTFAELLEKGSQKLNLQGNVKVFMQDGTEIEDDDVLSVVEKNSVLYLLSEGDPVSILLVQLFDFCHKFFLSVISLFENFFRCSETIKKKKTIY